MRANPNPPLPPTISSAKQTAANIPQEEIKTLLLSNKGFSPDQESHIAKIIHRNENRTDAEKRAPYENFRPLLVSEKNGIRSVDVDSVLGGVLGGAQGHALMLINVTVHTPGNEEKVTTLVTTDEWLRMDEKQGQRSAASNRQQAPTVMQTGRNATEQFLSRRRPSS